MLNQGQGTYPQLAGSFYNSAQMMPHDNGRNARQVPTFFGGLQNTISAASAMHNYQGMPLNQSILNTQALAHHQYGQGLANVIGGVGTGLGAASLVGGIGGVVAGKMGVGSSSLLMRGLGIMGGAPLAIAGAGVMATMSVYKKRMAAIEDMRNAMEGSRLGYGLSDPITGNLNNTAALQLSRRMEYSAAGAGFTNKGLKEVMGQASGLGMLNGMQSLGEVTKRVTDLAKASREIVMLGEGITMSDAMQLQKLTQDMGISTTKFRGMNIGKNLVMAARAAGMSMDQAAQVGGQGAMTFQQLGLGAASGMNAAFYSNIAAKGLAGVGAFSQRQLAALGGQQGLAQNLMAGQAGTMARMSDTLIMGAVKLGADGNFRIDRELLDRYIRGDVTAKELRQRGKDIGKGMSKGQRSRLFETLQFQLPELKEQVSDVLTSEEMMSMQGREILNLQKRTGMSMRRAAHAYFGDSAQAETFLGYAQNFRAVRAENERQRRIADNEQMLKYAGMAKSSSFGSRIGRGLVSAAEATGDFFMAIPTALGEGLASQVQRMQDSRNRGLKTILGIGDDYGALNIDTGAIVRGGRHRGSDHILAYDGGLTRPNNRLVGGRFSSYTSMARHYLTGDDPAVLAFLDKIKLQQGLNEFGGGGLGQQLTEFNEGEYSLFRQLGDLTGIEGSREAQAQQLRDAARIADQAIEMGQLIGGNNRFRYTNTEHKQGFRQIMRHLRKVSSAAAKGGGSGYAGGVDSGAIMLNTLRNILNQNKITDKDTQDAVIAEAYRTAKGAGGDLSVGFNVMLEKSAGLAGLMMMGEDQTADRVDSLRLASSTIGNPDFIEAKGLSSALAESGLSQGDTQEIIKVIRERGKQLIQDGAGSVSPQAVLKLANIRRDKYSHSMGGVKRVIDSLLYGGQVTTGKGKDRKTISLADSMTEDLSLDLSDKAVRRSVDADTLKRLEALDFQVGKTLGDGGEYLRRDLLSSLSVSDRRESDVRRARKLYASDKFAEYSEAYMGGEFTAQQSKEVSRVDDIISKTQLELRQLEESRPTPTGDAFLDNANDTKHEAKIKIVKAKLRAAELDKKAYQSPTGDIKAELQRKAAAALKQQFGKDVTDDVALEYYREKNTSLLSKTGTLSEALQDLAERQIEASELTGDKKAEALKERKGAYAKLMQGLRGAGLESEFREARSSLQGISDPQQRRQAELKLMEKIIEKARSAGIEGVPGAEKSKSLPEVLREISEGITEFKKAMQSVASIKNKDGELVLKLPAAK